MRRRHLLTLALVALILAIGYHELAMPASRTAASPVPVADPNGLTVEDVYRGAERTIHRPGTLYHATIHVARFQAWFSSAGVIQQWVDAGRNIAREEANLIPWGSVRTLVTEEGRFVRQPDGRLTATSPTRCRGVGVAASAVLGCPGPTERSTTEIQSGWYLGRSAIVLVTSGTSSGSDETITFTKRLYLDPETYLPLALESSGEMDFGHTMPVWERRMYRHEFIPAERVPANFFDPATIGYVRPDPEQPLNGASPDLTVYWLGRQVAGADDWPPLVLAKVHEPTGTGPGYRFLLDYARADDPFGPPVVTLQLWPRRAWDAVMTQGKGRPRWEHPCWRREDISLPEGRGTILAGYSSAAAAVPAGPPPETGPCPDSPPNSFSAHVYLGQTVVFVNAPGASSPAGQITSPYNSRDGMETIVRALRAREMTEAASGSHQ